MATFVTILWFLYFGLVINLWRWLRDKTVFFLSCFLAGIPLLFSFAIPVSERYEDVQVKNSVVEFNGISYIIFIDPVNNGVEFNTFGKEGKFVVKINKYYFGNEEKYLMYNK